MRNRFEKTAKASGRTRANPSIQETGSRKGCRPEDLIRAREAAGDWIAYGVGVALAVSSVAFFVYAIQTSDGRPNLPAVLPPVAGTLPVNKSLAARRLQHNDPDPTTTGSIRAPADITEKGRTFRTAALASQTDTKTPGRQYVLWKVNSGVALVEGPDGLREVVPGAVIPGAGQVLSIERSGTGWAVVTSETIIVEAVL
jgi:hypothetical protein